MALTFWGTGMSWANGDREEKTESRELLGLLDEQPPHRSLLAVLHRKCNVRCLHSQAYGVLEFQPGRRSWNIKLILLISQSSSRTTFK